jgi:putative aldouronate transport system permease protein
MRIIVGFPFPIILAILINEVRMAKFKRVLQTVYTFPHFLSWVLLAGIMLNLLGSNGMVRKAIGMFSPQMFEGWNLLYDGQAFRWLLILTEMWKSAGWGTIIYLAAIAGVDQALYESVEIDGANRFQRIWYITMPGIGNMIAIQFILRIGLIMEGGFEQVFNLAKPPVYATGDIIDTYIYRITFVRASGIDFGFPTAVGLFKNVINLVMLVSANRLTHKLGWKSVL